MSVRPLDAEGLAAAATLVTAYPFKPYRQYRVFSRAVQARLALDEAAATLRHPDGAGVLAGPDAPRALVTWRRLAWDTGFFGIPMARIDQLIGAERGGSGPAADALDACLAACRAGGVEHVSARVDAEDLAAVQLLESRGFRLMDALVTYLWHPGRTATAAPLRERGRVRLLEPGDRDELLAIGTAAYRGFLGRFHRDPHVPTERADALYVEWTRRCLALELAETVLVAEAPDGRLLGYLAFGRREPVSTLTGTPVFGTGLGACRADAPGAYAGLMRASTRWAVEHHGIGECQTQSYNFSAVRVFESIGARYARAEYTLHAKIR